MRMMYHKGDMILALSCNQLGTLRYEMAGAVDRARESIITHKSLSKAYKDPEQRRLHKNAWKRAITRHKQLKQLQGELEAATKAAF